jgi:hypothetical protein
MKVGIGYVYLTFYNSEYTAPRPFRYPLKIHLTHYI